MLADPPARGSRAGAGERTALASRRRVPSPRDRPRRSRRSVLSVVMVVIGVAMLVSTSRAAAARWPSGILLGVLFVAAGAGRLYLERARGREEP